MDNLDEWQAAHDAAMACSSLFERDLFLRFYCPRWPAPRVRGFLDGCEDALVFGPLYGLQPAGMN